MDFHGEWRTNAPYQSATDSEARLFQKGKGKEAGLMFMAHALMENRSDLLVGHPGIDPGTLGLKVSCSAK